MDKGEPSEQTRPFQRVMREIAGQEILSALGSELSGADLTTLLLEVMRQRAQRVSPAELMRGYGTSRFTTPGSVTYEGLRATEEALLRRVPPDYDLVVLAPLLPLGSHSTLGTIDQNRVVSTTRASEVAADPTMGLALEAATRRRRIRSGEPRSQEMVRLAAFQRVVRAQRFEGARQFTHFELLGLVSAGRDTGNLTFECTSASEQVAFAAETLLDVGASTVRINLTDLTQGRMRPVCDAVREALSHNTKVEIVADPDRADGRGYYKGFCFRVLGTFDEDVLEIGDGGLVDWTAQLLEDRKERLLISGLSVERLALVTRW